MTDKDKIKIAIANNMYNSREDLNPTSYTKGFKAGAEYQKLEMEIRINDLIEKIRKLEFMVDNGLGYKDLNDL